MAKRRSKIKTGGRTGSRITRRKGPAKQPASTRILTQKLDLNSVPPYDETCEEKDIHEEEVKGLDAIDTKTATAEQAEDYLSENIRSSEERKERPAKMKQYPSVKGKPTHVDKSPCTCPREVDGEMCLDVECGNNNALLYLSKLCVGSKGACIDHDGSWLTPNEFQFVSGRETAKDWKRSIRHNGFSLKLLIVNGCIELNASPPATSPTTTTPITGNNNNTKKQETVVKTDTTTSGPEDRRRRYIPVKRRNAGVKDKVVGRRKKIRRAKKKPTIVQAPSQPTTECQKTEEPDTEVEEEVKTVTENTPCTSESSEKDPEAVVKEDEVQEAEVAVDEKQSEEFFKTLQLSKTPSPTSANSPVAADVADADNVAQAESKELLIATATSGNPVEESNSKEGECNIENAKSGDADENSLTVVETFRSRLLPDETGLRIAINREVVCMKENNMNDPVPETEIHIETSTATPETHTPYPGIIPDLKDNKPETCKNDLTVYPNQTNSAKPTTDGPLDFKLKEYVKLESQNEPEEHSFVKEEFMKQFVAPGSTIQGLLPAKHIETKTEIKHSLSEVADCKCVDVKEKENPNIVRRREISATSPGSFVVPFSARDSASISARDSASLSARDNASIGARDNASIGVRDSASIGVKDNANISSRDSASIGARDNANISARDNASISAIPRKTCTNHTATLNRCDCSDNCGKDIASKETKLNKHITTNSIKCNRKIQESRTSTPKSVGESTFQEKSQYENDMLELMSIYRPVMVPCDGRCPYVCSDSTTPTRQIGETHSPYAACANNKWPVTSPFLSGVMMPEMMYYMTQQLYLDMYNNSLYAQCASNEKVTQAKPAKRKLPEPDQDHPLDLTVKKAKLDKESSKVFYTQDMDSPVDFSKRSSHHYDRKLVNTGKHVKIPHNGVLMTNGYNAKASPHNNSGEKMCTCGKKEDIRNWNVEKVCSFLKQCHDCAIYTKTFREQGIDGRLLPYLTMQHLTRTLGMQTGPATTFLGAVNQRLRGTAPQRPCQWCKG